MKGRVLKSWSEQEYTQFTKIINRVRQMIMNGHSKKDIYDYIAEAMLTPVSSRVLIYAGIVAGEMLIKVPRLVREGLKSSCLC